jgi:hypothetical protein
VVSLKVVADRNTRFKVPTDELSIGRDDVLCSIEYDSGK